VILFEICGGTEDHPSYRDLEVANGNRQYDFLRSIVQTSIAVQRQFLSSALIKALNYHAIACLHVNAGEYRPCPVEVATIHPDGTREVHHRAPEHYRVQALMDDFVNDINRTWDQLPPVTLAAYVLWRLNWIHPFINGNGRTARAACYFTLCLRAGGWLPGATILPELLRRERDRYVLALRAADGPPVNGQSPLTPLVGLIEELLAEQLAPFMATQQPQPQQPAAAADGGDALPMPPMLPAPADDAANGNAG
jgi:Fic family protein